MKFEINTGSLKKNGEQRKIKLNDNLLIIEWLGNRYEIKDLEKIELIKNIILKYQDDLLKYAKMQKENLNIFNDLNKILSSSNDYCLGNIANQEFKIDNHYDYESLNKFYNNLKEELFQKIESIIK
ncbi:MAG: hypothetical protein E7172_02985 [Firmicutes bacterium]|nr:hypothetical protein [Bacillota bacterium]